MTEPQWKPLNDEWEYLDPQPETLTIRRNPNLPLQNPDKPRLSELPDFIPTAAFENSATAAAAIRTVFPNAEANARFVRELARLAQEHLQRMAEADTERNADSTSESGKQ